MPNVKEELKGQYEYKPRHMTATEAMIKERNELYPGPWSDSIIGDMEEINKNRNKILHERINAKRNEGNSMLRKTYLLEKFNKVVRGIDDLLKEIMRENNK